MSTKKSLAIRWLLLIAAGILPCLTLFHSVSAKNKDGSGNVILQVSNEGTGDDKITLDINEHGNLGPDGFALVSKDDILILDTVKRQVQRYKQGIYYDTLPIGAQDEYTHIETDGGTVYLFGRNRLVCIDLETKKEEAFEYPKEELGDNVGWTFFVDGKILLQSEIFGNFLFDKAKKEFRQTSDGYQCERVGETDDENALGNKIKVSSNNQIWMFEADDIWMDVLGKSQDGYLFMAVIDANLTREEADYCTIRKYDSIGKEISRCSIDASGWEYYPRHYAEFGSDGNLYVMCVYKSCTAIYKISDDLAGEDVMPPEEMKSVKQTETVSRLKPDRGTRWETHEPQTVYISRAAVQARALNMKNYTWTFKSGHDAWNPTSSAPVYLMNHKNSGLMPCSETGIPYCWAGFNTMYTVTDEGGEIHYSFPVAVTQTLSNGKMKCVTGNTGSTVLYNTIGVDCSGFVSGAYGFTNKVNTDRFLTYSNLFTTIQKTQVRRMDFFVKSGHMLLFYQWENPSTGLFKSLESTTSVNGNGERDKVLCRSMNINSLSSEYTIRRPNAWHNCNHHQTNFTITPIYHSGTCPFCDKVMVNEGHVLVYSGGAYFCSICGYQSSIGPRATSSDKE